MSATIDADRFARYFGENVPVVRVPGLAHPVTDLFLEDVIRRCGVHGGKDLKGGRASQPPFAEWRGVCDRGQEAGQAAADDIAWSAWLRALERTHGGDVAAAVQRVSSATAREIDLELLVRVIECICDNGAAGAVLVFLPGWADITALHDALLSSGCTRRHACRLMPLHSQLPMSDQAAVFAHAPLGVRKIIIATGIAGQAVTTPTSRATHACAAETSITIDDVVHVVDSGRCKSRSCQMHRSACAHLRLQLVTLPPLLPPLACLQRVRFRRRLVRHSVHPVGDSGKLPLAPPHCVPWSVVVCWRYRPPSPASPSSAPSRFVRPLRISAADALADAKADFAGGCTRRLPTSACRRSTCRRCCVSAPPPAPVKLCPAPL